MSVPSEREKKDLLMEKQSHSVYLGGQLTLILGHVIFVGFIIILGKPGGTYFFNGQTLYNIYVL